MNFTVYEGTTPVAQVQTPPDVAVAVQERPASRLPVDPLPIPPPGYIVINQQEAEIFGLAR